MLSEVKQDMHRLTAQHSGGRRQTYDEGHSVPGVSRTGPMVLLTFIWSNVLSGSLAILNFGSRAGPETFPNPARDGRNRAPWARGELGFS